MRGNAARQILQRTLEVLERDGWCRGTYQDSRGRRCLSGAMERAAEELKLERALEGKLPLEERMRLRVALAAAIGGTGIVGWNDAQRESRAVKRALKRAIESLS